MSVLTDIERAAADSWLADELVGLATGDRPGEGQVVVVERTVRGHTMPPLHRRDEAETYRVLEGAVTFFVGRDVVFAREGSVVVAPAGAARTFRVDSDSARWVVLTRVRSLDRYTDFGRAVSAPPASPGDGWPSTEEHVALSAMASANGIELLGPPGSLPDRG